MIKVKRISQTCGACPSQWSGKTADNEEIYIRYRWGTLSVSINNELIYSEKIGDDYSGTMDFFQLQHRTEGLLDFDGCMLEDNS